MLVIGGYLITYDQLQQIGDRRGLDTEDGNASILNKDLQDKGIFSIYAFPVDYPRRTRERPGVPGILICTRKRDDYLVDLAKCKPFIENDDDLKVKKWLEIYKITDAPFVAVPDPHAKYNEYGSDY